MLHSVQLNEHYRREPSVQVPGTWGHMEQLFSCGSGHHPCSEGHSLDQQQTDDVQLWL